MDKNVQIHDAEDCAVRYSFRPDYTSRAQESGPTLQHMFESSPHLTEESANLAYSSPNLLKWIRNLWSPDQICPNRANMCTS